MIWFALLFLVGVIFSHAVYFRADRKPVRDQYRPPSMERLYEIAGRAAWHREQQEALAAECCRLFFVNTDSESNAKELCEEIVYSGMHPDDVVDMFAHRNTHSEG